MEGKVKIGYDEADNSINELLQELVGDNAQIDWNIEGIARVRDAIESVLADVYDVEVEFVDDSIERTLIGFREEGD